MTEDEFQNEQAEASVRIEEIFSEGLRILRQEFFPETILAGMLYSAVHFAIESNIPREELIKGVEKLFDKIKIKDK